MAERYTSTMTQRGQVTVPARVRRILGLKPQDKVTFQVDGQEVRLVPVRFTLETAFASVPPLKEPKSLEEMLTIAREEHARHVLDEMKD